MSTRARSETDGLVQRYLRNRRQAEPTPWRGGPANSIDRLIDQDLSAPEISAELGIPRWVVIERFAARQVMADAR